MIFAIPLFLLTLPIRIMAFALGIFGKIIPPWINDGITQTLGNSGFVGSVLPMQAHPGMWGLAGETGIMPIIGFILLIGGYIITIDAVYLVIKFFVSFVPWHTNPVKMSKLDK